MALVLVGVISLLWTARVCTPEVNTHSARWLIVAYFVAAVISFFATRQHGYYFVREVLRMYQLQEGGN